MNENSADSALQNIRNTRYTQGFARQSRTLFLTTHYELCRRHYGKKCQFDDRISLLGCDFTCKMRSINYLLKAKSGSFLCYGLSRLIMTHKIGHVNRSRLEFLPEL